MIWQNDDFFIEQESSELPWVKIFTKTPYKELSDLPPALYGELWALLRRVELAMLEYYKADKINVASFANQLPRVHLHVIARFSDDGFFPNSPWGERLRPAKDIAVNMPEFAKFLSKRLD